MNRRQWETVTRHSSTQTHMELGVMSYNVLAQHLLQVNRSLYHHCDPCVLDWSYRGPLLIKEIVRRAPKVNKSNDWQRVFITGLKLYCN